MKNPGLRSGKAQIVKSRKEVLPKMSNKNAKQDGGRNRQGAAFLNAKHFLTFQFPFASGGSPIGIAGGA